MHDGDFAASVARAKSSNTSCTTMKSAVYGDRVAQSFSPAIQRSTRTLPTGATGWGCRPRRAVPYGGLQRIAPQTFPGTSVPGDELSSLRTPARAGGGNCYGSRLETNLSIGRNYTIAAKWQTALEIYRPAMWRGYPLPLD